MIYHIERFMIGGWVRVCSALASYDIARNMIKALAKANNLDPDNYSILVEVTE